MPTGFAQIERMADGPTASALPLETRFPRPGAVPERMNTVRDSSEDLSLAPIRAGWPLLGRSDPGDRLANRPEMEHGRMSAARAAPIPLPKLLEIRREARNR